MSFWEFNMKQIKRIAVTGGAGQIAYNLLFRLASGEFLGDEQPLALHILEVPAVLQALEGVKMELQDCAFPLLKEIHVGADPYQVFQGVDYAFLVGAKPRGPGMERGELLQENGKIFVGQGKALNDAANANVKVLVVGNPCNTNCLIAMTNAPKIPRKNFHAMTRLDEHRAKHQLAQRAGAEVKDITNMAIWGNHSSTQVPDFSHAKIKGRPASEIIDDANWLENDFISAIQKRGAAIIEARGKSSAASAAHAALQAFKDIITPTPEGEWYSSGVCSDHNPYGIEENLIFSFPCRTKEDGEWEIVKGLTLSPFMKEKVKASEKELIEERNCILKR